MNGFFKSAHAGVHESISLKVYHRICFVLYNSYASKIET